MVSDFKFIALWWLTISFLSCLSLPLIFSIFRKFWDKGYIFSKIVSLALITYIIFILGVFKFLPFTNSSIFAIIFFFLLGNLYYLSRPGTLSTFKKTIKNNYKTFILEELIFFFILILWSYIRGFARGGHGGDEPGGRHLVFRPTYQLLLLWPSNFCLTYQSLQHLFSHHLQSLNCHRLCSHLYQHLFFNFQPGHYFLKKTPS